MNKFMARSCLILATVLYAPVTFSGELVISDEFWVGGPGVFKGDVGAADVAIAPDGTRIYVWRTAGINTDRADVIMRRFDDEGNPLGDAVRINTLVDESQDSPAVAAHEDGSFLVAWRSYESDTWYVRSQAFNASGNPVGTELLTSNLVARNKGFDINVDVAALRDVPNATANFVVSWQSAETDGDDDDRNSIQARMILENGTAVAPQFQVNTTGPGNQFFPAITETSDGGFFVVWSNPGITGQRFDKAGTKVGGEIRVDTSGVDNKREPQVTVGRNGEILVVWEDLEADGITNEAEIYGRLYNANLSPLGSDFRVNTLLAEDVYEPSVAEFGDLGFLVAWAAELSVGSDSDGNTVQGRIVTGPGTFADSQVQLNTWTDDNQFDIAVHGRNGEIALAWESRGWLPDIYTGHTIVARNLFDWLKCPIFCDGFE